MPSFQYQETKKLGSEHENIVKKNKYNFIAYTCYDKLFPPFLSTNYKTEIKVQLEWSLTITFTFICCQQIA